MNIDFEKKVVFLTGASRGIGLIMKEQFIKDNAIVIAPTRDELDLGNEKSVENYLQINKDLKVDIIVHCASLNVLAGIDEISQELIQNIFQINVFSITNIVKKLVPNMIDNKYGKIVFISSIYSTITRERRIAYTSSKNATTGLMKTLALELAPHGIMVNAVSPGYVMTDMTKNNLSNSELDAIIENIPTKRLQTEVDIYKAVRFLVSEDNQSITGQNLTVDGGFTCR